MKTPVFTNFRNIHEDEKQILSYILSPEINRAVYTSKEQEYYFKKIEDFDNVW